MPSASAALEAETMPDSVAATGGPCLNTDDAARYVALAPATLTTLRCRGGGPRFIKLRSRVVYRVADLDAWLDANVRANTVAA